MTTYLSNRNSDGYTDENGHFRLPLKFVSGQVLKGLEVSARTSPNMKVNISAGEAKIDYSDYAYAVWSDSTATVTIPTSSPSGARVDVIVAYVDRGMEFTSDDVNNPGALKFMCVSGTPDVNPVPPTEQVIQTAVGIDNPWIELAEVFVGRNVTQIVSSEISDTRTRMKISSDIELPYLGGDDKLKVVVINEGEPLPQADPNATTVVLVARN